MKKLTKIIATIGPSCDSESAIKKLLSLGVNIFRFNFKHNTVEWHNERIERVNKIAKEMDVSVGTLIDLQGPEIRITMPTEYIELSPDERIAFGPRVFETREKGLSITHAEIIEHIKDGERLIADDGAFVFVMEREGGKTHLRAEDGGTLLVKKSLNIPGNDFPCPVLLERDLEGIKLAAKGYLDYVALSFVRSANDICVLREEMKKHRVSAKIVSKIETKKAIDAITDIVEETDAIMVARGDLGIEIPIEEVPFYQKLIIRHCIERGVPVITATQMLQSMIQNPYPTRAEVSDVANAVYDLTDAVMLSGETATGKYVEKVVTMMAKTVYFHEQQFPQDNRTLLSYRLQDKDEVVCDTAYNLYLQSKGKHLDVAGFLIFTQSGRTARMISRYRPRVPLYVFTPSAHVRDSLSISYGIRAFVDEVIADKEVTSTDIIGAVSRLLKEKCVQPGQKLITLHGDVWAVEGGTSTVKIVECRIT